MKVHADNKFQKPIWIFFFMRWSLPEVVCDFDWYSHQGKTCKCCEYFYHVKKSWFTVNNAVDFYSPAIPWHSLPSWVATTGNVASSACTACWQILHTSGIMVVPQVSEAKNNTNFNKYQSFSLHILILSSKNQLVLIIDFSCYYFRI